MRNMSNKKRDREKQ